MSLWTKCLNRFHFSLLTVRQTEVPLVSLDRRGSTYIRSVPDGRHIVSGLHTPKNAILRRMPLAPSIAIQMEPFRQHVHLLKSAPSFGRVYSMFLDSTKPGEGQQPPTVHWGRTELEQRLLAGYCALCGSTEDIQVHHVRAMRHLHEYSGRPKPEWVKRMIALKRKTLPLCRTCHEDVDHGRPLRRQTIKLTEVKALQKRAIATMLESRMP
jgi:hypothetical protein